MADLMPVCPVIGYFLYESIYDSNIIKRNV